MHGEWSRTLVTMAVALATIATFAATPTAASASSPPQLDRVVQDWELPVVVTPGTDAATTEGSSLDADPHGLVPKVDFVKRYSLDADHFEVWLCGAVTHDMSEVIAQLEGASNSYFSALSGGLYTPVFSAGRSVPDDPSCAAGFFGEQPDYTPEGSPEAIIIIDSITGGGFATPGPICGGDSSDCPFLGTTFPENGRYAIVGENALFGFPAVAVHEMGHTLHWPHSFSGITAYEYDNPIDVMSANSSALGNRFTEPLPYATLSYNRYQSGWVDPADVVVASPSQQELILEPFTTEGTQLLTVKTDVAGQFYVLGARKSSQYDPIPPSWEGVEVYLVDHDCGQPFFGTLCPGLFREHHQQPPNEYQLDHVLVPGDTVELEGITIAVTGATATGFSVVVAPDGEPPADSGTFLDDDESIFEGDIEWLAAAGLTVGCNPPLGSLFCPTESVTRGQMAAFLARALGLPAVVGDRFSDDDGSVFELDIEKLATAGITSGCNPPRNDHYCPTDPVTRGQMAAFLVRALDLPTGPHTDFIDDNESVFEDDIGRLAAAGITAGCNPPVNDRFCPNESVTRGQMAAFLRRALES